VEPLPKEFKAGYPGIEWSNINRMRNLVAHQYDKVNDDPCSSHNAATPPALITALACPPDPRRGPSRGALPLRHLRDTPTSAHQREACCVKGSGCLTSRRSDQLGGVPMGFVKRLLVVGVGSGCRRGARRTGRRSVVVLGR